VLKPVRKLADVAGSAEILSAHLAETLHLLQAEIDDGVEMWSRENKGLPVWAISGSRCRPVYLDQPFLCTTVL